MSLLLNLIFIDSKNSKSLEASDKFIDKLSITLNLSISTNKQVKIASTLILLTIGNYL